MTNFSFTSNYTKFNIMHLIFDLKIEGMPDIPIRNHSYDPENYAKMNNKFIHYKCIIINFIKYR